MAGVDELIKRGYVDPKRLGVTGGSGGGLLTNWTIDADQPLQGGGRAARHRRLARLLVHRRLHALHSRPGSAAPPWEDPQDFKARSPITYVDEHERRR